MRIAAHTVLNSVLTLSLRGHIVQWNLNPGLSRQ
jgi:hypothetical protein